MSKSDAGKGDTRRPKRYDVSQEEIDKNWEMLMKAVKKKNNTNKE